MLVAMTSQPSFFFYDLETSGVRPRSGRIMQFGGQRTSLALEPLGEAVNTLIKLSPDVLPEPDAVLITAITPQNTIEEGISEAEFLKLFDSLVALPGTIFVGFNSIRFDDEFMRYARYRNFWDAYEWQWRDSRSRWDLLDVVRLTRALRPEGIKWPNDASGQPSNRLELLTAANQLDHSGAHDALSDVRATIALAKLIRSKQPKLFDYLLNLRDKNKVRGLVSTGQPFVYASGKYSSEYEKATLAVKLAEHPAGQGILAYDLREDPSGFLSLSAAELAERWRYSKDPAAPPRLPVKTLKFNRCPAVAPLSVLDDVSAKRLQLGKKIWQANWQKLLAAPDFMDKVVVALEILEKRSSAARGSAENPVDEQLYEGFFDSYDQTQMQKVRSTPPAELSSPAIKFHDRRLGALLPLYKARNFPSSLAPDERQKWDEFCAEKLFAGGPASRLAKYFSRIDELAKTKLTKEQSYLLEELRLYGQSLIPAG